MTDHLKPTRSQRGFTYMPPLPLVNGGIIRVYESSNPAVPCVWLSVNEPAYHEPNAASREQAVQIHVSDAERLVEQLLYLIEHHHSNDQESNESV